MTTVGIIGFGSFGRFLAEKLDEFAHVSVYSRTDTDNKWSAGLAEVARCDYVILSVPLGSYQDVIAQLQPHLASHSIIVDVCSVKVQPIAILRELLPNQPMVATHPMFGPESAADSLEGHSFIMCPEDSDAAAYETIRSFAISSGLDVIEMSAEQHDREIATVQGLTFFVARTLNAIGIHDYKLHTPSFARLLSLADLERHHSQDLFQTIQTGNEYVSEVRSSFIHAATKIHEGLEVTK